MVQKTQIFVNLLPEISLKPNGVFDLTSCSQIFHLIYTTTH